MKNIIYFGFGKLGTDCLKLLLDKGYKINYIFTHQENKDFSVDTLAKKNDIPFFYFHKKNTYTLYMLIFFLSEMQLIHSI